MRVLGMHSIGARTERVMALVGVAALLLLASACGQHAEARSRIGHGGAVFWGDPGSGVAPSPNGENTSPEPAAIVYKFTVATTKTIKTSGKLVADPLHICPVQGRGSFSDDFGAPRFAGGFHLHQGNDVFAALGTPIVAPFDGRAVATPNWLGGLAVKVFGPHGYVYNAHLVGYGTLGQVATGEVIGYVGNTGDARGGATHDHFEWHPGGGPAVDPFPYLKAACVG